MFVTPAQIKAARAMLDWSAEELGKRVGVAKTTISAIETGRSHGSLEVLGTIVTVLQAGGIEFQSDGGIRPAQGSIRVFQDHEGMKAFFDLVYDTCVKQPETQILQTNANESLFSRWLGSYSPVHIERMSRLQIPKVRAILKKGDTNVTASAYAQYRWTEEKYFGGICLYVFGPYTGLLDLGEDKCTITLIENALLAQTMQSLLLLAWDKSYAQP